jgi:hypothetical protein
LFSSLLPPLLSLVYPSSLIPFFSTLLLFKID